MISLESYKEIEKVALGVGPILLGALSIHGMNESSKELKQRTQLPPPTRSGQVNLDTPYSHQFSGGNRTDGKMTPTSSLYK